MGSDHSAPSSGQDAAKELPERADIPSRASILGRLAPPARVVVLAALGLGLGFLSVAWSQQASQASAALAAAPAVAQVAAPEASVAAVATPTLDSASTPSPSVVSADVPAALPAAASIATSEAVEPVAGEPVADQDELLRELRPQLSARGGLRGGEASLSAELAVAAPSMEELTASVGFEAAPKTPVPIKAPTKAPTKTPTPKPAPTRTPTPRPVATTAPVYNGTLGQQVVSIALRYVGYRYTSGGTSPSTGFDCSGFVYYVYKTAGHPISRDIFAQYRTGVAVSRSSLMPGDLVFFQNTYRYGLSHASIYIGGGRIVHAQSERYGVTTSSLADRYWSSHYLGARRP